MTKSQFHDRLLRLIKGAMLDDLCPVCTVAELLGAVQALCDLEKLTTADLESHGLFTLTAGDAARSSRSTTPRH